MRSCNWLEREGDLVNALKWGKCLKRKARKRIFSRIVKLLLEKASGGDEEGEE